jgi:hypothetical protein
VGLAVEACDDALALLMEMRGCDELGDLYLPEGE